MKCSQRNGRQKVISLPGGIPTRRFGDTGYALPVYGLGSSTLDRKFAQDFYGLEPVSEEECAAMIRHAYDSGVRYFDTARVCREGERIMGKGLKGVRDDVYLATKVNFPKPEDARKSVEQSLSELNTDYVDCMQIHHPVIEQAGVKGAMEVHAELEKLRGEGVLRFIGFSTHVAFRQAYETEFVKSLRVV